MQICIFWNVWIAQSDGKPGKRIFTGYRDCECKPEDFLEKMKGMADGIIKDLDEDIKKALVELGHSPKLLMKMEKVEIK